jgi:glycosyltransferase involved in cell wall biosynthesis
MNIVHIPRRFVRDAWGGTETVVLETARRQILRGDSVGIATSMALSRSAEETIEGVPVRRYPYMYPYLGLSREDRDRMDRKGGNLVSFGLYRSLMAMRDPDIFHLHTGKRLGALVRTAARKRGIPYLVTLHGGLVRTPQSEKNDLAEPGKGSFEWGKLIGLAYGGRRVVSDADGILCVDRFEADQLRAAMPRKRIEFMPNGVDPERFKARSGAGIAFRRARGIPVEAPVVLVVGRIDPQKNQLLALDVLERLRADRPDIRLVLAGPATNEAYRSKLEAEIARKGLTGAALLAGQLDYASGELAAAYAAADCFLLPSIHEPFGVVALEAWAAKLPLVAAKVGGIPAFVTHRLNGLLFAPGTGAESAGEATLAIREILADRDLARALVRNGQSEVEAHYTWDRIVDRLDALYEELRIMSRPAGKRP